MAWRVVRFTFWSVGIVGWTSLTVDAWHGKYDWFAVMVGCITLLLAMITNALEALIGEPS